MRSLPYEIPPVNNGRELIAACVRAEIDRYNREKSAATLLPYLGPADIQKGVEKGKIANAAISRHEPITEVENSIAVALRAHEDGLFLLFIDDEEIKDLNQNLHLTAESTVAFVRLTALTGTYW